MAKENPQPGKPQSKEERLAALANDDTLASTLAQDQNAANRQQQGDEHDDEDEDDANKPQFAENQAPPPARRTDPGVDITAEQARKIEQVVNDNTADALAHLTDLRDRADGLMHTLRSADLEVKGHITNYTRKVAKTIRAKVLIARALAEIEQEFNTNGQTSTVISQDKK